MGGSAADILDIGRGYVNVLGEDPPGSNCNEVTEWYGQIDSMTCYAWCAAFVSRLMNLAGVNYDKQASCWYAIQRYKDGTNGDWLDNPGADGVRPGDQFFLGSVGQDHTGIVEAVDDAGVTTIEGNWANGVRRVWRSFGSIYGFGRPHYDAAMAPDVPPSSQTEGRPWLRLYSQGADVGVVQLFLQGAGLYHGQLDNDYGTQTEGAVEAWQRQRGLGVDGVVGPATWADIDAVLAYVTAMQAPAPAPDAPSFPGTTRIGSRNRGAIVAVQERLADRGWAIKVDGVFGAKTKAVVEAFQREKGLVADGIAGPLTWVALWTSPVT